MAVATTEAPAKQPLPDPKDIPTVAKVPSSKAAIVGGNERAPAGWKRFKVRGETVNDVFGSKYLVAKSQEDAEQEYSRMVVPAAVRQVEADRQESVKIAKEEKPPRAIDPTWKRPYLRLIVQEMQD